LKEAPALNPLMRIWRICKARYADEAFLGHGARRFGGRWNSPGVPMVYASPSLSLAAIELFVHLEPNLQPDDLVSISASLPEGEPARRLEPEKLPPACWTDDVALLQALGDRWISDRSSLAIQVPSAAMRMEWNVLVNPLHPRIAELKIEPPQPFHFDARMFR
jgi:RES domain-containing protein